MFFPKQIPSSNAFIHETKHVMQGKNIIIIGGNSGIGKAISESLKSRGANLYLYSKSGDGTTELDITEDFDQLPDSPDVIDGLVCGSQNIQLESKSLSQNVSL